MEDLIKALTILLEYLPDDKKNERNPTNCEHDVLYIMAIDPYSVSTEDRAELEKLGVSIDEQYDCFYSFRFGSA